MRFSVKCKLEVLKLSSEPILLVKAVKFIANTIIYFLSGKSSKKDKKAILVRNIAPYRSGTV